MANDAANMGVPSGPVEYKEPDKVFEDTVKGKFPLSRNIGSARYWAPNENVKVKQWNNNVCEETEFNAPNVPRPNVNLNWLRFWSAVGGPLGLDHFYANSPATGIAKLLTLGGFGLWWIWDNLQLWLESDRVLNYGMMPLFDLRLHDPVAQGMITDKPQDYQRTWFSLWAILEVFFGITGANQAFYKKYGLWFFYTVFFLVPCILLYAYAHEAPTFSLGGKIMFGLAIAVFTVFGLIPHSTMWISNAIRILAEPEKLFAYTTTDGLYVKPELLDTLNPYAEKIKEMMPSSALFESFSGERLRNLFAIRMSTEQDAKQCQEPAGNPLSTTFEILGAVLASPFAGLINGIKNAFLFLFSLGKRSPTTETSQSGGAAAEPLSTESMVLGGTLIALILGGVIKGTVDNLTNAA
jgi:hypothetical protein